MTDEICKQRLAEAQEALHALRTGQSVVSVTYNDRRVDYSKANMNDLLAYVDELERQCGTCKNAGRRKPFRMIW